MTVIIFDGDGDGAANGSEIDIVLRLASERRLFSGRSI